MARLLIAAMREGAHDVDLISRLRSFLPLPDPARMRVVEAEAEREVVRICGLWTTSAPAHLWLTYHPYYKAPDLVGPHIAARFGIPYVAAEASHAGKRAHDAWADWHRLNEATLRAADLHLCFTPRDAAGLAAGPVAPDRITMLPPFIAGGSMAPATRRIRQDGPVRLVTVAMMRPGDKARSYAALAAALMALSPSSDWHLTIVGDGPERPRVEAMFRTIPKDRLTWDGERDAEGVAAVLAASDLYVWPGFAEAYGLAYLEAQGSGLPVLAMDCGGISSVVSHEVTGLLTPEGDIRAFASALARLIAEPEMRDRLGQAGRRMVLEERTLAGAARRLNEALSCVAMS